MEHSHACIHMCTLHNRPIVTAVQACVFAQSLSRSPAIFEVAISFGGAVDVVHSAVVNPTGGRVAYVRHVCVWQPILVVHSVVLVCIQCHHGDAVHNMRHDHDQYTPCVRVSVSVSVSLPPCCLQ